jgi:hypothetical protein
VWSTVRDVRQGGEVFGVKCIEDIDGDACSDLILCYSQRRIVSAPASSPRLGEYKREQKQAQSCGDTEGIVELLSGRTGAMLGQFKGSDFVDDAISPSFGKTLCVITGADREPRLLAIGAPYADEWRGIVVCIDVHSLEKVFAVSGSQVGGMFGLGLGCIEDMDADGWQDIVVGAPGAATEHGDRMSAASVTVLDGRRGTEIRSVRALPAGAGRFLVPMLAERSIVVGCDSAVADGREYLRLVCLSLDEGKSWEKLVVDPEDARRSTWPARIEPWTDATQGHLGDLIVTTASEGEDLGREEDARGRLYLVDAGSGDVVRSLEVRQPEHVREVGVCVMGDMNHDSQQEFLVFSARRQDRPDLHGSLGMWVCDGASGVNIGNVCGPAGSDCMRQEIGIVQRAGKGSPSCDIVVTTELNVPAAGWIANTTLLRMPAPVQ